jgi:hypothetical protein
LRSTASTSTRCPPSARRRAGLRRGARADPPARRRPAPGRVGRGRR